MTAAPPDGSRPPSPLRSLLALLLLAAASAGAQERPQPLKGGIEFQSPEVRALQADTFASPGQLWVDRGQALWTQPRGGSSCAQCHGEADKSMRGVATRYPRHDKALGRVVDLDGRVRACSARQGEPLAWESQELLSLTAFVGSFSRGMLLEGQVQPEARATYERGRTLFFERQGQLNLACTQCHDGQWGRKILHDTVSQGHPVDWPAYRLEWQSLGSLQRRLRACYFGVRAEMPPFGHDDLVALQLYLAERVRGLPTTIPGVRR